MNDNLLLILPGGLIWLPIMAWVITRLGQSQTATIWIGAWLAIWLSGVLLALSPEASVARVGSVAFGTLFSALLVMMTYAFQKKPIPGMLPPTIAVLMAVKMFVEWNWPAEGWYGVAAIDVPLVGFAAWRLVRHHTLDRKLGLAERLIGPMLVGIAAVLFIDFRNQPPEQMTLLFTAWLTAGVITSFVMLLVIAERSQRRLAEHADALDAERHMLDQMLEAMPMGVMLSDREDRIERMNQVACKQVGVSGDAKDWRGHSARETLFEFREDLVPEDRIALMRVPNQRPSGRAINVPPFELRFEDGRILVVSANMVRNEDGSDRGRVWVSREVSDERRVNEKVRHAERMQTVATLAGGLAHDFNNQLTAIVGCASLLMNGREISAQDRDLLKDLIGAAEHCAGLTHELLAFAQGERAEIGPVDLATIVDRVVAEVRLSLPPDVEIQVVIAPEVGSLQADEFQLQRVLRNLLVNASGAVGEHGMITLRAESVADRVKIEVHDDGPGMDEATRRRVFDPFFTTRIGDVGARLGLAVAYGIVEAHGGSIEVESASGRGTTFRVEWPSDRTVVPAEPPRKLAPMSIPRAATILFAEDEPTVRRLLTKGLEQAGLRVIPVANGDAAIAEYERCSSEVDVLVFDQAMGSGLRGTDVVRAIRRRSPRIPAIIISGHALDTDEPQWPEAVQLVRKPFMAERLAEEVWSLLQDHSP